MRPKPRRNHPSTPRSQHSSHPQHHNRVTRPHPPRSVVLPPEFEQVFALLDDVYGDPREAEVPLDAELWTSAFLGGLWKAAIQQDEDPELSEYGLVEVMEQVGTPRTQAVLCGVASVGTPEVAALAAEASQRLLTKGVKRPAWYPALLDPVEFLEGWSVSDVFADSELLIAAFRRGRDRYAFTVTVANNAQGSVVEVLLVDPEDLPEVLADLRSEVEASDGVLSLDRLDGAELRRRLEPPVLETVVDDEDLEELDDDPLDAAPDPYAAGGVGGPAGSVDDDEADLAAYDVYDGEEPDDDDEGDDFASLRYLLLSRLGILPEPTVLPAGADLGYDLADLPALLGEFIAAPEAQALPHPGIVREWGEVFIRLGAADFAGDPPLYGPEKFDMLINVLIPARINAKASHLEVLRPCAEAWAVWSTRRVGLSGAVTGYLLESIEDSFLDFEDSYEDPGFALDRHLFGYTLRSRRSSKGRGKSAT